MIKPKTIDRNRNREGYDQWSKSYDTDLNATVFADEAAFPPYWTHLRGRRVLEIGCGTGRHTQKLAGLGNDVTALDLSPGMLAVARARPQLSDVSFIESDIFRFSVAPKDKFDAVIAALVLEHVDDLKSLFAKVASLLKPGGEAFFSEIHPSRMQRGSGARFRQDDREEVWLDSMSHTEDDFLDAIAGSRFTVLKQDNIMATMELMAQHLTWNKYAGRAMLKIWHLTR